MMITKEQENKIIEEVKALKNIDDCVGIKIEDDKGLFIQVEDDAIDGKMYFVELNDIDENGWYPCDGHSGVSKFGDMKALINIIDECIGIPTFEEIKRDYNELMGIIKDVRTIEQIKELDRQKKFTIEINGMFIDEFLEPDSNGYVCTDKDIEWVRYESYGCLAYIYDRFDGKPMFDVWSDYSFSEFIYDITIDKLTRDLYEKSKKYIVELYKY